MIKDIVVSLSPNDETATAIDYSLSLAAAFEAHIAGVAFIYEPAIPGSVFDGAAPAMIESMRAEAEQIGRATRKRFDEAVRRAGVSAESHLLDSSAGRSALVFGQVARHFDLSVVVQPRPDGIFPDDMVFEDALFHSGRPVLMVPYARRAPAQFDRIMVCWDGSRAATRAIADSMPILQRGQRIEIVTVSASEGPKDELPGFDIAHHLARHGITVQLKNLVAGDADTTDAILSYGADTSTDLIVMGGYGHSRLRQFILGGVTRGMLSSMTIPTLMSH